MQCGRPHNDEIVDMMRPTRARYHYTVRYVIIKEETHIESNRMAEAISVGNVHNIWEEVHILKKILSFSAKCYCWSYRFEKILLTYFPQRLNKCTNLLDLMKIICTY